MADHPEDLELAQRLAAGDARGFELFFEEYHPRVYRFALSRLGGDREFAGEIAQATLVRAMRKIGLYRGEASLFTWLCQIARNEIHDQLEVKHRDAKRFVSIDDDPAIRAALESLPADPSSDPVIAASRADTAALVRVVLDYLPSHYGNALEWKYVEGLDTKQIAERLAVTSLAAESLLARARRMFRDAWQSVAQQRLPDELLGEAKP